MATIIRQPYFDGDGKLVMSGTNTTGWPGSTYSVLSSANLAASLDRWVTNTTGVVGTGGNFSNAITLYANDAHRFFILRTP
jgi:hypothetical protein